MGFLDHYDCRLGLGDTGPYELDDRLILVRDCFVNEKSFPWTFVVGDLPFSYSMVLTFDKEEDDARPQERQDEMFSIYNTGTLFCDPPDYEDQALMEVAVYMRDEDYPNGTSTQILLSDLPEHIAKLEAAVERMYRYLAMKPWFDKILEGNWVYVAASLPYVRAHDLEAEQRKWDSGIWTSGAWNTCSRATPRPGSPTERNGGSRCSSPACARVPRPGDQVRQVRGNRVSQRPTAPREE